MISPRRSIKRAFGAAPTTQESRWFWEHYDEAAREIVRFSEDCGLALKGLEIADVGCGDGIMALGLFDKARPSRLVGFDLVSTSVETLLSRATEERATNGSLPRGLEFRASAATSLPADDAAFDFVYSWSAFEHIAEPIGVLKEIRRVLRPGGHFFLQLWPFYLSAKGSHLWDWFDEDFHHLLANDRDIVAQLEGSDIHTPEWRNYMAREFEKLNRITLEELQRAVLAAGFDVSRLELITSPAILTPDLGRYAWADLGVGGIKLLAKPRV
jgi:ubiquinone/menaquinone biosynthesis C-methylase UbiE